MILQRNTASLWRVLWRVVWRQVECAAEDAVPCMGELQDCLEWRTKTCAVLPVLPLGRVPWAATLPKAYSGFVLETTSWWTEAARKRCERQGRCNHYPSVIEYVRSLSYSSVLINLELHACSSSELKFCVDSGSSRSCWFAGSCSS